jgi:hypothetical protein
LADERRGPHAKALIVFGIGLLLVIVLIIGVAAVLGT